MPSGSPAIWGCFAFFTHEIVDWTEVPSWVTHTHTHTHNIYIQKDSYKTKKHIHKTYKVGLGSARI
jgi:hypothetical protein